MHFLDELKWRGLHHQNAGEHVEAHINSGKRLAYCGFDPTADSLTVGNFLAIKMLMHWQRCGHQPIVLMGGGTGLIGDPSGKDAERSLQTPEQTNYNISQQIKVFERLLDFDDSKENKAIIVNNYDWLKELSFIEALRDIGKHFSVNQMMQRDSVKIRLENRDRGISYTEFSYMLLQAYDFLHLYETYNVTVQLAGSDQYGNIVSGMDLIRRRYASDNIRSGQAFGITNKLVTKSDGTKIGKSVGNPIWLSAEKTSAYKFYQFWLNTDDADVIKFLRWFTFLDQTTIEELQTQHNQAPHERSAHKALAQHMTELVHGKVALDQAISASKALFGGNLAALDERTISELFEGVPSIKFDKSLLGSEAANIVHILVKSGLAESNSRAREFVRNGAVSVNGEKISVDTILNCNQLLHGHTILLKRGKKNWAVTRWV